MYVTADGADASNVLNSTTLAFLWALAGIILGGTFTYLAARLQVKQNFRADERRRLLKLRTKAFHRLWMITERIPRNPDANELATFRAANVVHELNKWYFRDGGMYLPNTCRQEYFVLIGKLDALGLEKGIDKAAYDQVYTAASTLRQALAKEVDARTSTPGRRI